MRTNETMNGDTVCVSAIFTIDFPTRSYKIIVFAIVARVTEHCLSKHETTFCLFINIYTRVDVAT